MARLLASVALFLCVSAVWAENYQSDQPENAGYGFDQSLSYSGSSPDPGTGTVPTVPSVGGGVGGDGYGSTPSSGSGSVPSGGDGSYGGVPSVDPSGGTGGIPTVPSSGGIPTVPSVGGGIPTVPSVGGGIPTVPSVGGGIPTVPSVGGGIPTVPVSGGTGPCSCSFWAAHVTSWPVTVLESRDRIGGRVCTDYSFGFPVDMGASWLHGLSEDNPLASVIGRLGLPLYRTSGDNSVLYDHDLESYALFDAEGLQIQPEMVIKVGKVFEDLLEETKNIREEFSEDMSVGAAMSIVLERRPDLRLEGLPHRVLQWYLCRLEGWFAADTDVISLSNWDEEDLLQGGHGLMVKGYMPVLFTLAEGLDIRLNFRVVRIIHHSTGVRAIMEDGTFLDADAAVVAAPLGVLKAGHISFEPKLPAWKQSAIQDMGVGNENKIALLFDQVFWPDVDFLGVVAPTSYECSYFLNLHKATGNPVLIYMPAGRLADDLEKLGESQAVEYAFSQLKKILPDALQPTKYLVSRWGSDTNTLGCYCYDVVGKADGTMYERLAAPVKDILFFAGEATSRKFPGTVHGAFQSGLLAASRCKSRLAQRWKHLNFFQATLAEETNLQPLQISRM